MRDDYRQRHFQVYEIVLPFCNVCTSNQPDGAVWNTPKTCVESSDSEYSLFFTKNNAPFIEQPSPSISGVSILNSAIYRCVKSATESTPLLKGGTGMASRSTMTVNFADFVGDPGPLSFSDKGSFFGKLLARNVLQGKKIITRFYSKVDGEEFPTLEDTSTHFITSAPLSNGILSIKAKDSMKDFEVDSQKFPLPTSLVLDSDMGLTGGGDYAGSPALLPGDVVKIDNELILIDTATSSSFTVLNRGDDIVDGGDVISTTTAAEHKADDAIQLCEVFNDGLSDALARIFTAADQTSLINTAQWSEEIDLWNAGATVIDVFHEPEDFDKLLNRLMGQYMLDMWLDQSSQLTVIAAVSSWKDVTRSVVEGRDFTNIKISVLDDKRFSRAFIVTNKADKTATNDITSYSRSTLRTDVATETSDFFGDVKLKDFGLNSSISSADANLLCGRFIERYSNPPKRITFNMEESQLAGLFLGDVLDIFSRGVQGADGTVLSEKNRAQIIRMQPDLNSIGRKYAVTALSYIAANTNTTLTFSNDSFRTIDIHTELNAPGVPVNAIIILDGAIFGSGINEPAITAGSLVAGSTVTIYMINGATLSAKGGDGGESSAVTSATNGDPDIDAKDGVTGSNSYQSNGIFTEIFINYPETGGFLAEGVAFAAGGGGGAAISSNHFFRGSPGLPTFYYLAGSGGSGGSGFPAGAGGINTGTVTVSADNNFRSRKTGSSGTLLLGGDSVSTDLAPTVVTVGGEGGPSIDGQSGFASFDNIDNELTRKTDVGGPGQPGFLFIGGNIIVYNTNVGPTMKLGQSVEGVDFTLVDAVRDFTYEFTDEFA